MKIYIVIMCLVLSRCDSNSKILGEYKAMKEETMIESITIDETVVSFGGSIGNLMPAAKYEVKNNKIYVGTNDGIFVFRIIDANTIEGETFLFKGDIYKK